MCGSCKEHRLYGHAYRVLAGKREEKYVLLGVPRRRLEDIIEEIRVKNVD
jgi:hypothetical protein